MSKKSFIITIDTESDNQWSLNQNQTTNNSRFVPRFQELCERFGFKPVYLVDYSMAQDSFFVDYVKECANRGCCEIGMHLHAWNTPPFHEYDNCKKARPYLIEYPQEIMYEKILSLHNLLEDRFERAVQTHRAGRWMINTCYLDMLSKLGYKVDCTITPGINWSKTQGAVGGGMDYTREKDIVHFVGSNRSIMEVPMTVKKVHKALKPKNLFDSLKEPLRMLRGRYFWLRPALCSNTTMLQLLNKRKQDYIEFMMHSSELMPGGSPYFPGDADIEKLYLTLEELFSKITNNYGGMTLTEYYDKEDKVQKRNN